MTKLAGVWPGQLEERSRLSESALMTFTQEHLRWVPQKPIITELACPRRLTLHQFHCPMRFHNGCAPFACIKASAAVTLFDNPRVHPQFRLHTLFTLREDWFLKSLYLLQALLLSYWLSSIPYYLSRCSPSPSLSYPSLF